MSRAAPKSKTRTYHLPLAAKNSLLNAFCRDGVRTRSAALEIGIDFSPAVGSVRYTEESVPMAGSRADGAGVAGVRPIGRHTWILDLMKLLRKIDAFGDGWT